MDAYARNGRESRRRHELRLPQALIHKRGAELHDFPVRGRSGPEGSGGFSA